MLEYMAKYCDSIRCDDDGVYVAVLKPEYAVDGLRVLKCDNATGDVRNDRWVTINGAHVMIGKDGVITGGAGGRFNGKKISDFAGKKKRKLSAYKGTPGKVKGESNKAQANSEKTSLKNLKSLPKFVDKNKENKYKLPDANKEENSITKWRRRMKQMTTRSPEHRGYLTKEQLKKSNKKSPGISSRR